MLKQSYAGLAVKAPEELSIAYLCMELKMGYNDVMNQPQWLLDTIHTMKKVEGDVMREREKEAKRNK